MVIREREYCGNGLHYHIRSAEKADAAVLSRIRIQIDGETDYLDREPGEAFLDEAGFQQLIASDTVNAHHLFLVAVVNDTVIGFSRCEGCQLKRFSHKVEFGICILREYWGHQIGKRLLEQTIAWADTNGIKKICLNVLETNHKAIQLYEAYGFEAEGMLRRDKILSDGNYYNTIVMGRIVD
jgi:GNAT superfamily N-acetyltransferase